MGDIAHISGRVLEETEKIIVGKRDKIRLIIMAVLAGGHVLLDDLPGVGKTTLLKTLSIALGCIQAGAVCARSAAVRYLRYENL